MSLMTTTIVDQDKLELKHEIGQVNRMKGECVDDRYCQCRGCSCNGHSLTQNCAVYRNHGAADILWATVTMSSLVDGGNAFANCQERSVVYDEDLT